MTGRRGLGPVGRYVAVVATLATVLGALWWSGAVVPRARLPWTGAGATTQGRAYWEVREVANPGPLPVQVEAISWTPNELERPQVRVSELADDDPIAALRASRPFVPFELGPGERRSIVLSGWVVCLPGAADANPSSGRLAVTVAAPLGRPTVLGDPKVEASGANLPCPLPEG